MTAVAAACSASLDPALLMAVTSTRIVCPWSALPSVYVRVVEVLDVVEIVTQVLPLESQRWKT
jgi:hypothetical protein